MILRLPHCTVRPWERGDAAALVRHANDREIWRNLRDRFPHPYTDAEAERWLAWVTTAEPVTHFAIEADGEATGGIGFSIGEDVHCRVAEIGYWLGRAVWGRGIATRALAVFLDEMRDQPVYARVARHNIASLRVLQKRGFSVVGEGRVPPDGAHKPVEEIILALTAG